VERRSFCKDLCSYKTWRYFFYLFICGLGETQSRGCGFYRRKGGRLRLKTRNAARIQTVKRAEFLLNIWRQSHGILKPKARVAVIGGGISGLHLAYTLAERNISVTIFEPKHTGGVRIPLMHACHTLKVRAPLWEKAAEYSRAWYRAEAESASDVFEKSNEFGSYFNISSRPYLRHLKARLAAQGVEFRRETVDCDAILAGFNLTCIATGSATALGVTRTIPGWESYFSRHGAAASDADVGKNGDKITNYISMNSRAGFIHRNGETRESATAFGKALHPTGRHALFQGERLTTRDRFPVVGFADAVSASPFLFCAMGYHAMTYAPFLADVVTTHLAGGTSADENLISTLSPARFLPRT
jgi:FAD dependent oxidoreductase